MNSLIGDVASPAPSTYRFGKAPSVVTLDLTLSSMFLLSFAICVILGLASSEPPMRQILGFIFPGFVWLSWASILIGIVYSVIYGWYIAAAFTIFYGWFGRRLARKTLRNCHERIAGSLEIR